MIDLEETFKEKPYLLMIGDSFDKLKEIPDNSIDSIVTDPPYGLGKEPDAIQMLKDWVETGHHEVKSKTGFMGKSWDNFVPQPILWNECLRVLKPGGHLLSFAGTRTYDLVVLGLRLAGFEIRDQLAWVYGSGMPKALDVSKAITAHEKFGNSSPRGLRKARLGDDYTPTGQVDYSKGRCFSSDITSDNCDTELTEEAKQWDGWKSSLKPAQEPIVMARKPLEGTIAQNVLKWHTGALNIDECRVPIETGDTKQATAGNRTVDENGNGWGISQSGSSYLKGTGAIFTNVGRFPSNFIHDGSDEVLELFPDSNGAGKSLPQVKITGYGDKNTGTGKADYLGGERIPFDAGSGSAARFFYSAKASKADRNTACDDLPNGNNHPTVKPISLCDWLVKLVTPPNGIVLDPFNGSGSTGRAAMINEFKYIGIDLSQEYIDISERRIQHTYANKETIKKELTNKVNGDKVKPVEKSSDKESSLIDLFRE